MPLFIDPTGEPTYGIGLCARCSRKFPLARLRPDPNSPGLMVCEADADEYDPYRLPARQAEDVTLPFTRPDVPLEVSGSGLVEALALESNFSMYIATEDSRILQAGA